MPVLCYFKRCKKPGIHRVKSLFKKNNWNYGDQQVPRVCEVHYFYLSQCVEEGLEPDFNIHDDDGLLPNCYRKEHNENQEDEFEDVEYLDEYIRLCPRIEHSSHSWFKTVCSFFQLIVIFLVFLYNMMGINQDQIKTIRRLQNENTTLKISLKSQDMKHRLQMNNYLKNFRKIFNEDQLDVIHRQLKRPREWSDKTILKGLKTKFACKKEGYMHLQSDGYPYPSTRVLRKRLEGLNFEPGILDDVFLFMKEKVKAFNAQERECQLVIDGMSIIEGTQYDIGTQSFVGNITIPMAKSKSNDAATHLLIFMIRGLSSHYKQIVGYEFTGNSTKAEVVRDKIIQIVQKAEEIGLKCNGLTADMGGSNTAIWRLWGIIGKRKGNIVNYITHPCDAARKFWIIGDVPHLLKRIVQGIMNNGLVIFDKCIVKDYNLPGDTANCKDFFDIYDVQKDDQLKLAPKLKSHILCPNNFQKMNVPVSTNLIGSNVSTGLLYLHSQLSSDQQKVSTYQTTAWFSQILTRWFALMTSRNIKLSLTKYNYEDFESELNQVMEIIRHCKFGKDGKWKPFQRGILVSTTSVLEMSKHLLNQEKFEYVLTGSLTQDCVENLFSNIRFGNPKPNALQVRNAVKSITVSEYLQRPEHNNTSYEWDDSKYLTDFLKILRQAKDEHDAVRSEALDKSQCELKNELFDVSKMILNRRERNVLYKIACHLLYKITVGKKKINCDICLSYGRTNHLNKDKKYTVLMGQPNLQYNSTKSIVHIDDKLFKYFVRMEKLFRVIYPVLREKNKFNLGDLLTNKLLDSCTDYEMPQCHSLKKTITKRFIIFRLKNSGIIRERKRKTDFSSHSMN